MIFSSIEIFQMADQPAIGKPTSHREDGMTTASEQI
jgi:hypothetical protein